MALGSIQLGPVAFEHTEGLLATLVGFALLVWLVRAKALPPIAAMLAARTGKIQDDHDQVERALAEAETARADYAKRLADIETEARARLDRAVHEADEAGAEIIADARASAEALRKRGDDEVQRERSRAGIRLRRDVVSILLDSVEKSIRTHADEPVQRRLIRDFIERAGSAAAGDNGTGSSGPRPRAAADARRDGNTSRG